MNNLHLVTHKTGLQFNTFGGEVSWVRGKVSFEQWVFYVRSIQDNYPEATLREGIVRSLRGGSVDVILYLGPQAGVEQIFKKLEIMYGTVSFWSKKFYRMQQN